MELLKGGCNMSIISRICDNTCKSIMNVLQLVLTETRHPEADTEYKEAKWCPRNQQYLLIPIYGS